MPGGKAKSRANSDVEFAGGVSKPVRVAGIMWALFATSRWNSIKNSISPRGREYRGGYRVGLEITKRGNKWLSSHRTKFTIALPQHTTKKYNGTYMTRKYPDTIVDFCLPHLRHTWPWLRIKSENSDMNIPLLSKFFQIVGAPSRHPISSPRLDPARPVSWLRGFFRLCGRGELEGNSFPDCQNIDVFGNAPLIFHGQHFLRIRHNDLSPSWDTRGVS